MRMSSMFLRAKPIVLSLLLAFACVVSAVAEPVTKQLAPGVTLVQIADTNPHYPLVINQVAIDLASPGVEVRAALGQDVVYVDDATKGREIISALTARRKAIVGVNADFFPFTGDPLGICIVDGEIVSEPPGNRAAIAITSDKSVFFDIPGWNASLTVANGQSSRIDGINRIRDTGQIIIYTDKFGASTRNKFKATEIVCTTSDLPIKAGKTIRLTVTEVRNDAVDTPIPQGGVVISGGGAGATFLKDNIKLGDTITACVNIKSACERDWTTVQQSVAGGPWLVREGKEWIDYPAEGWEQGFAAARHPRTAVGLTADNKLLLVTVDGRQMISGGISLSDLATLMIRLGAVTAINLDGGGSTTLSVRGTVTNSPSEGIERAVANGLIVCSPQVACEELPKLAITGIAGDVPSGPGTLLGLVCGDEARPLSGDELKDVVWGTTRGVGFVNQSGYFTPIKARRGTVTALVGSQLVSLDVNVVPGAPAKLTADLAPDQTDPLRAILTVKAADVNGNRVVTGDVSVTVTGGKPDLDVGPIAANGEFTVGITWDPAAIERGARAAIGKAWAEVKAK